MIQTNDILQWVANGIFWLSIAIVIAAGLYMGLSCEKGADDE